MTREEAIEEIKNYNYNYPSGLSKECRNYIIKALEQEPCEDAVSRTEVLNLVRFNAFHVKSQIKAIENMPSVTPQEQFKPMVEIDLYSVIKQSYIEREVLDKIRAEIEEQVLESLSDGGDDWSTAEKVNECLDIIDKYKAESEET